MTKSPSKDDELQRKWLEKHKDCDFLVYEKETGLPKKAVYMNPIYTTYIDNLLDSIEVIEEAVHGDDGDIETGPVVAD